MQEELIWLATSEGLLKYSGSAFTIVENIPADPVQAIAALPTDGVV